MQAIAHARENFIVRAAMARRINHERSAEDKVVSQMDLQYMHLLILMLPLACVLLQTYDVGLFATNDLSYLPCGIASMTDSHPAVQFDPDKMGQHQRLPKQSTQKQSVWCTLRQILRM